MNPGEVFELLEARTGDVRVEMPWRRDRPWMNPHAVFSSQARDRQSAEAITAVIGKNGTGKSHLLTAIAQTFILLDEIKRGEKSRPSTFNPPLEHLAYRVDERVYRVIREGKNRLEASVDGKAISLADLSLPRRVVALTSSPFDKFPVPRTHPYSVAPVSHSIYHYLGLRDRFGKAAIETLLFRSLTSLFEASENEALRSANIGAVFEFLGLRPTLSAIYRLMVPSSVRGAVARGEPLTTPGVLNSNLRQHRTEDVIRSGVAEEHLRHLIKVALDRAENGVITMTADFGRAVLDDFFVALQPIRRAGFLRLSAVEVTLESGLVSDLKKASSGQLSVVSGLLALASAITNGSLVLIDEPELSLHPEWQLRYVDLLLKTFSRYRGCHFVVATHSPLVVSELPSHANVISLDSSAISSAKSLVGQSADYLLAEAFDLSGNRNRYVRERIVEALNLVAGGNVRSAEFANVMEDLQRFSKSIESSDPAKTIIENLSQVVADAGKGRVA